MNQIDVTSRIELLDKWATVEGPATVLRASSNSSYITASTTSNKNKVLVVLVVLVDAGRSSAASRC